MGIREIGYRHWEGRFTADSTRWWAIARQSIRVVVHNKGRLLSVIGLGLLVWIPYFFYGLFWFLEQFEEGGGGALREVFGGSDRLLRRQVYDLYRGWATMVFPLFAAAVIAPMIANDLRSNALYIYLSKPLRRVDYIAGKSVAALVWCLPVTVGPGLFVWALAVISAKKVNRIREPVDILGEILITHLLLALVVASVLLALSSFSKRWWVAFSTFVGGWYVLWILSQTLQEVTYRHGVSHRQWLLTSGITNLIVVANETFERISTTARVPSWDLSLTLLLGLIVLSVVAFAWRILKLEVAE